MGISYGGDLDLGQLGRRQKAALPEALHEAADIVLEDAVARVPKVTTDLADTGKVDDSRGGDQTVGIVFDSVYARWIHEHLGFKHVHGGEAKFLEIACVVKGQDAIDKLGERLGEAIKGGGA